MSTVGDRIKMRRHELRITQGELAEKLGYKSKSSINKIELGKTDVTQSRLIHFADALKTTPAYLMGISNNPDEGYHPIGNLEMDNLLNAEIAQKFADLALKSRESASLDPEFLQSFEATIKRMSHTRDIRIQEQSCLNKLPRGNESPPSMNGPIRVAILKAISNISDLSASEVIGYEEIDSRVATDGDLFGLQVNGDSMEPKFSSGDVVIVKKQSNIANNEIGVFMIENESAIIRKAIKHDNGMYLAPLNTSDPPIFFTDEEIKSLPVKILGKVIELRAKF